MQIFNVAVTAGTPGTMRHPNGKIKFSADRTDTTHVVAMLMIHQNCVYVRRLDTEVTKPDQGFF